jgi:twitching motility protein PilT
MNIDSLLSSMVEMRASDLHLKADRPPLMRVDGKLEPIDHEAVSVDELIETFRNMMSETQLAMYVDTREADFSYEVAGVARYRVNLFHQRGLPGGVIRMIPTDIPTIEDLGLPEVLKDLTQQPQGLVLVTGPTGSGKSTTLAAMINHINHTRHVHVMTLEDPIEFTYEDTIATINQRELGSDTLSLKEGLKRVLRQDPDVILMGEMRDAETIETAIHAAETGHLVFSTLHTNDAKQSIDRILDSFPAERGGQIRQMLALSLRGVVSQRLVRKKEGGRTGALEILINSPAISELIEAGNTRDIEKAIVSAGEYYKMQNFNMALYDLVQEGTVHSEIALASSPNPADLELMLKGIKKGGGDDESFRPVEAEKPKPKLKLAKDTFR